MKVRPFDVSLRDGLQGLSKEQQIITKPINKVNLYYEIKQNKKYPNNIIKSIDDVGSIIKLMKNKWVPF